MTAVSMMLSEAFSAQMVKVIMSVMCLLCQSVSIGSCISKHYSLPWPDLHLIWNIGPSCSQPSCKPKIVLT